MPKPDLTVSICTRDRVEDVARCVRSLVTLMPLELDVIVVDNGSAAPVEPAVASAAAEMTGAQVRVIRPDDPISPNAARNLIARMGRADVLLSIDDDAYLLSGAAVRAGLDILSADPGVGIVALTQTREDGTAEIGPDGSPVLPYACRVSGYAAYGALLRREPFVELGGYNELGWATFEEPDFARRLLDAGWGAVWLPVPDLVHIPSPIGRDEVRRMRFNARNACYSAIRNEPLPMLAVSLPARAWAYRRVSRVAEEHYGVDDRGGLPWVVREVVHNWRTMWRLRRPLRWRTYQAWRHTKRTHRRYP